MSVTASRPSASTAVPSQQAVMAQTGNENFPVATYLLGRRERAHLLSIYGFARLVDDLGDEAAGDRTELLAWVEADLDRIYSDGRPEHPVMRSLAPTVTECRLPDGPFRRLIEANRRDQLVSRYATFEELLGYCQLSAAPVGELVLHVFGVATPERIALSDRVCAALQVTEHLQDVGEDYARGRVYLPQEDLARFGCRESDLGAARVSPAVRELLAFEALRTRGLLEAGRPLVRSLAGRPRVAVAGFVAGGRSALDALKRAGYEVLGEHPRPGKGWFTLRWLQAVMAR